MNLNPCTVQCESIRSINIYSLMLKNLKNLQQKLKYKLPNFNKLNSFTHISDFQIHNNSIETTYLVHNLH